MNYKAVFVDTWGWMALGYRREPRHAEVKSIYQELRSNRVPIHTTDYVLDEVITLLFRREKFHEAIHFMEGIFAAAALGQVRIERVTTDRFLEAWELRKQIAREYLVVLTRGDVFEQNVTQVICQCS